mmetsp:Transcript_9065/g.23492  ORF Transcript_9065/g.23492 Transcript_9065/m.23492 type:complete len:223 (-) Transcript_9065:56-724(-)
MDRLSRDEIESRTELRYMPFSRSSVRAGNFSKFGNALSLLWPTESFFSSLKPRRLQSRIKLCDRTRVSRAGLFFADRPSSVARRLRATIRDFKPDSASRPTRLSMRLSLTSITARDDMFCRWENLVRQLFDNANQHNERFNCKKARSENLLPRSSNLTRFSNDSSDAMDSAPLLLRNNSVAESASLFLVAATASERRNLIPFSSLPSFFQSGAFQLAIADSE